MGNKQSTGKKGGSKHKINKNDNDQPSESLQNNLVALDKHRGDEYNISVEDLGAGKETKIKKAHLKKYCKTAKNSGDVAIKLFDGNTAHSNDFQTEAAILSKCDHPNIVKLFEITKVDSRMSLVLELCDGGSVLDRLPYTEDEASKIVRQVASAISYMHGKNIVHRDIECSNILYSTSHEKSEVKLVDFGSATELETIPNHPGAFKFLKEKTGSLSVMAPEVLRGKYGPKVDVWSIGIVAHTLLNNGKAPFKGKTKQELEPKILQGYISYNDWEHSELAKDFCQNTCMVNVAHRLAASTVLFHSWIASERKSTFKVLPVELVTSFSFYRTALPLKRIALNALARKIKSSKYRETFEHINKSHTGLITNEEFMEAFKHSGNSKSELDDLYDSLDINVNGGITYTEFIAATLETGGELEDDQLHEAFNLISSNGRYITQKDVEDIVSESLKDRDNMTVVQDKVERQMSRFTKKHKKQKIRYLDFTKMFEHGFKDLRSIDTLVETSLNAEQFKRLNAEEQSAHLMAINE